jgi:hypothetical protein
MCEPIFGLSCFADRGVTDSARPNKFSRRAKPLCFLGEMAFYGVCPFNITLEKHGGLLSF